MRGFRFSILFVIFASNFVIHKEVGAYCPAGKSMMDERFQWFAREVEMPALDFQLLREWISAVAASHGRIVGALSYVFCNDEHILEVNRKFLDHDYYTDIITFDDCRGKLLRGDMFISLDTVRTNALKVGATYRAELLRVIIHGVLHLCGINDKGPGEREVMEANEDRALAMLASMAKDSDTGASGAL